MNPDAHPTGGNLFRNMVLFGRLLRSLGIQATPPQLSSWMEACRLIDLDRRQDFFAAGAAILVTRREDLEWFRRAFDLFWTARDPRQLEALELGMMIQKVRRKMPRKARQKIVDDGDAAAGADGSEGDPKVEKQFTYSARELLRRKDFADLDAEELVVVRGMMHDLDWQLEPRRSRRRIAARRGATIDFRRTLRRSLRRGGEPLELARRRRKEMPRSLVLLCDISGSMEAYSRILLQFLYVTSRQRRRTETFVFGTRLTRITLQLRHRDVDQALREVHQEIEDFGGGTRIGECLRSFNYGWSRRVLNRGAAVIIISDGWDRGEVDLMAREVARLQRSCQRLIWLNPLLGSPRYEPLTRGIQAALPHIDDFLPVHNLASLEQLAERLGDLSSRPRLNPYRSRAS